MYTADAVVIQHGRFAPQVAQGGCLRTAFHDSGEHPYIVPGCLQSPAITAWERALHAKLEAQSLALAANIGFACSHGDVLFVYSTSLVTHAAAQSDSPSPDSGGT